MERRPEKTAGVGWHRGEIASFFLSFSLVRFFWTSKRNEQNEILTALWQDKRTRKECLNVLFLKKEPKNMKKRCSLRTDPRLPAVFSGLPNFKNDKYKLSFRSRYKRERNLFLGLRFLLISFVGMTNKCFGMLRNMRDNVPIRGRRP
ncbi:MAG: hypothetical protein KKG99_07510 [Bacteroidetes bacterium]|nr:hypothetical protein [Bacteroidota bacterium]